MMSSALAMVLMAAMAVPGNGPEKVSGEVVREGLDLSGEWEGVWRNCYGGRFDASVTTRGQITYIDIFPRSGRLTIARLQIIDEGSGKIRGKMISWNKRPFLGIYEQYGDYVIICYREAEDGRSLRVKDHGHYLLILHRVKPGK